LADVTDPVLKSKSQLRRAEILSNARTLFESKGFANTSINDIAIASGMKRENVYYYYQNRGQILLDLVRPNNDILLAGMAGILSADIAPVTKLYLALLNHMRMFDRVALDTVTVGLRGIAHDDRRFVHEEIRPLYKTYENNWVALIKEGVAEGVFRPTPNCKLTVFAILGMCNWLTHWYDPNGPVTIDGVAEVFFDLIAGGLIDPAGARRLVRADLERAPQLLALLPTDADSAKSAR
jgi:TetR/AcrR family transcriptional regulator, cholesterol catabolism regulator